MGVLILAGLAVVIATIVARMDDDSARHGETTDQADAATANTATADPGAAPVETALPLPAGCRVADIAGAGGRLALRLAGPTTACARVLLVNPVNGQLTGTLRLESPAGTSGPDGAKSSDPANAD